MTNRTIPALSPICAIEASAIPRALGLVLMTGWEAAKPTVQGKGENKVAVIPIQGVLSKDGPSWYGTNYKTISNAIEGAASDSSVKRIVLAVDSPGGDVQGLPETAEVLQQAAKMKPVSAIVEGTSASAAYWLTSQAHDVTLTPSGEVGSVGVRMMHVDASKMLSDMGYAVTELYSGDFKTEWSPYKPLSEEAKADMQPRLDAIHKSFIAAVANGRKGRASASMVRSRYGEGRMFSAPEAFAAGLVDRVQSAKDFYGDVGRQVTSVGLAANRTARARLALERLRVR